MSIAHCVRPALSAVALLLFASVVSADTLKVPSDDFPTIQSAITAASGGDVIKVAKGVYAENLTVFTNDLTLQGKNAVVDGQFLDPCIRVGATGVTITGFTFVNGTIGVSDGDGEEGFSDPEGLVLSKCVIRSCTVGVRLRADDVLIERNTISDCRGLGIALNATEENVTAVLSRNVVERVQGVAMSIEAISVTLERNQVRSCFEGIEVTLEIETEGGNPLPTLITRNRVEGCLGIGLTVADEILFGLTTIEKNRLERNGRGLTAYGANFRVLDNTCNDNSELGMSLGTEFEFHFVDSEVLGNQCRDNGASGMLIDGPPICRIPPSDRNLIQDNDCQGNGMDGIVLRHAHQDRFLDNTCKKNGGDGIDIDVPSFFGGIEITDNVCSKNEHEGIDNNASNTEMSGNVCKGNARGVGPDIAGTGDDGMGSADDDGGNKFDTGGFDVQARLDLDETGED